MHRPGFHLSGSSRYQLIVERIELAGLGALMAMLEGAQKTLAAEGLFDAARKKRLPFLPAVIGIVTSPTGAVIRDIMHRLADRCPRPVMAVAVAVQGERAPAEIAAAIRGFNGVPSNERPDVIIVARGGGSVEDLLAFSDEAVVRAAAVSDPADLGVGHETDTTLIDFAADMRAPTPTAAAEMAVPVLRELVGDAAGRSSGAACAPPRAVFDSRRRICRGSPRAAPGGCALRTATPALRYRQFPAAGRALPEPPAASRGRHAGGALSRPRIIASEIATRRDNLGKLDTRLFRGYRHRVQRARNSLDGCLARSGDPWSYRAILSRGFALIRSPSAS